ncbi:MAG: dihydroorotase [Bdellovibrionia bacterium]
MNPVDLLLKNAVCYLPTADFKNVKAEITDIAVKDGVIYDLGRDLQVKATITEDLSGLHLSAGLIDSQVHFREPGMTHKEDLETGTLSALYGGITAVFEMPNTQPSTTTRELFYDKLTRAKGRTHTHYAFYFGASQDNLETLKQISNLPHCPGIKIFMGSSTGSLLVDSEEILESIVQHTDKLLIVHSEDEKRLRERKHIATESQDVHSHPVWRDVESAMISTQKIVRMAEKHKHRVHVLHISSADEMTFLKEHKDYISVEVLPQHLTLYAPDCYDHLGTLAQQNPPIREKNHLEGLWQGVLNGTVDVLGSDHAPHTLEEKANAYPQSPSGVPGVQTMFPLMLTHAAQKRLTVEKVIELLTLNVRRVFDIKNKGLLQKGMDADFTIFDPNKKWTVTNEWIKSRSQWTPFNGMEFTGAVDSVFLRGKKVLKNNELLLPNQGEAVEFN